VLAQNVEPFRFVAGSSHHHLGVPTDLRERHTGRTQLHADLEPLHLCGEEYSPARGVAAHRRSEQSFLLLEAQGVSREAGQGTDSPMLQWSYRQSYGLDFESTRTSSVKGASDERNTMTTTWFITGTSSGFGRLLTEQLLARGDRVAATLRRPGALDDLRARYGGQLWLANWTSQNPSRCDG